MRSLWKLCLLLLVLQSPFSDCYYHHQSDLAHILAAGLVVQMLSHHHKQHHHGHPHHGHHHHGHHHHEGRHAAPMMMMEQPFHGIPMEWAAHHQESRIQPDLFAPYFQPWPHHLMMASQSNPVYYSPHLSLPRY